MKMMGAVGGGGGMEMRSFVSKGQGGEAEGAGGRGR